jgi:glutamate formiminotransferase
MVTSTSKEVATHAGIQLAMNLVELRASKGRHPRSNATAFNL